MLVMTRFAVFNMQDSGQYSINKDASDNFAGLSIKDL